MICAITGQPAQEPVVSPRSGSIFEKSVILKYLQETQVDPVNDEPLSADDLININPTNTIMPPKPVSATSIPGLLSAFQNEWDSLALELFTLRKQLNKAREELSAALYHHDAALRVAAKAINERDEARDALQQLSISIAKGPEDNMLVDQPATNGAVNIIQKLPAEEIDEAHQELLVLHKSQKHTLAIPNENISVSVTRKLQGAMNAATCSYLDAQSKKLFVGSSTGESVTASFPDGSIETFKSAAHDVSQIAVVASSDDPDKYVPIIVSEDNSILIGEKIFKSCHSDEIVALRPHPSLKNYFVTFSKDGSWAFNDTYSLTTLFKSHPNPDTSFVTGDIHSDGAIIAGGTSTGTVIIYSLSDGNEAAQFSSKYSKIKSILFGPNGYWLFVSSSNEQGEGAIDIFDLRKVSVVHTIETETAALDLVIDLSSQILVANHGDKLVFHRYMKKGKKWIQEVGLAMIGTDAPLIGISWLGSKAQPTTFVGVNSEGEIIEYQLEL